MYTMIVYIGAGQNEMGVPDPDVETERSSEAVSSLIALNFDETYAAIQGHLTSLLKRTSNVCKTGQNETKEPFTTCLGQYLVV